MNKYPGRISKKQARKLFEENKPFVIVPCKCYPYFHGWSGKKYGYHLTLMASVIYPQECEEGTTFDSIVNSFEYYNCHAFGNGSYAAFYEAKPDVLATYV